MLKGKTIFELTNVNTGEKETYEDTNMVTNALQEFVKTYGYFSGDVFGTDFLGDSSFYVDTLGGLFLFDTRLDENVNNIMMPAGVRMVGNGSYNISNSGSVTELGSYNTSESGLQPDGSIKFVYDFSTSQANGSIACACLTSKLGGYIGMGNSNSNGRIFNEYYNFTTFISKNSRKSNFEGGKTDMQHVLYASYNDNAIYLSNPYNIGYNSSHAGQHWSTTKKIQILKVKAGFTSIGIKERLLLHQVAETYDIDIPQDILTYMGKRTNTVNISADTDGNVFVVFNTGGTWDVLDKDSFCWIMKIDRERNVTHYKFTNNVGSRISLSRDTMVFNGEYMFVYTYDSPYKLYRIKYSDSTQIIEIRNFNNYRSPLFNIDKNIIGMLGDTHDSHNRYAPLVCDVFNNELWHCNGSSGYNSNVLYIPFIDKKGVYMFVNYDYSGGSSFMVLKEPRYLATINNLSETVIKTADKTMKVTYIIKETN